jgi:hypothetical protein
MGSAIFPAERAASDGRPTDARRNRISRYAMAYPFRLTLSGSPNS